MREQWFYFGCNAGCSRGHRLEAGLGEYVPSWAQGLQQFDDLLRPHGLPVSDLAVMTRLGGWNYSALSWIDNTGDTRPGSNAIVFAPGLRISEEAIWTGFRKRFPNQFKRYDGRIKTMIDGVEVLL